ncbi:MAG: hypothetical protein MZV65_10895 [Chromatiales bacterium]|nr:hypothetical protein [Chromatiales bacterium]
MTGGEVGGLLETRTSLLDKAQNELGLTALNLATRFNEQNQLGLDLDGRAGYRHLQAAEGRGQIRPSAIIASIGSCRA